MNTLLGAGLAFGEQGSEASPITGTGALAVTALTAAGTGTMAGVGSIVFNGNFNLAAAATPFEFFLEVYDNEEELDTGYAGTVTLSTLLQPDDEPIAWFLWDGDNYEGILDNEVDFTGLNGSAQMQAVMIDGGTWNAGATDGTIEGETGEFTISG